MPRKKTRQSTSSQPIQNHSMNEFLQDELTHNDTIETNMTEDKSQIDTPTIDQLLLDLKILSQIKKNDKICTNNDQLSIDNPRIFQGFSRWFYNNSRDSTMEYIETTLHSTLYFTNLILTNESISPDSSSHLPNQKFHDNNSELLKKFYLEMLHSVEGLKNLKATYEQDITIASRIQLVIDKLEERINKIDDILKIQI